MFWLEAVLLLAIGFVVGCWLTAKGANEKIKQGSWRQENGRASDRASFLFTVSRELANILIWENPDDFLNLYKQLHVENSKYGSWKPEAVQELYDSISAKYPQYQDFDVLGVRRYVLYPGASMMTKEELAEHFSDITRFIGVLRVTDEHWSNFHATTADELNHLTKYVQKIKDTKFHLRIQRAVEDFYLWRRDRDEPSVGFDTPKYSVKDVWHFAENRYGIHLKETNEYGLYSFFVFDDGRISHTYCRSDPSFLQERRLDIDYDVFRHFGGVDENREFFPQDDSEQAD